MSTEIKNTLFRFVTMRAPELVEKEKIEKTFVQHPDLARCFFIQYFADYPDVSKKVNLKNGSAYLETLSTTFKNREELRDYVNTKNNDFFKFATWLTANRKKFTLEELDKMVKVKTGEMKTFSLNNERKIILWDNLLYQILTSKSSYIREAILSVLAADLFLQQMPFVITDLDALRKLAQARVIMPKEIFSDEAEDGSLMTFKRTKAKEKPGIPALTIPEFTKSMEITVIQEHLSELKSLKNGVSILEKRYDKVNARALAEYQKAFDLLVKEAYEKAEKIETVKIDPITKEEIIIVEYKDLVLPEFEFSPEQSEIEFLGKYASKSTYYWIIKSSNEVHGYDTFKEILDYAKEKEHSLNQMLFDRTAKAQKYKSSNGMLFPIVKNARQNYSDLVILRSIIVGQKKKLLLEFYNIGSGTSIAQANYTMRFDSGNEIQGTSKISNWVDGKLQVTLFNSETILEIGGTFILYVTFITQDGREISIEASGNSEMINNTIGDPMTDMSYPDIRDYIILQGGSGRYDLSGMGKYRYTNTTVVNPGNPDPGTNPSEPEGSDETYIPTGFGIRRLGIADYRKVEQEICCYVPGEVSHIENVMASEYKERSTRRLRRTEDTTTTSKEKESEKLTDTSSTDRFEMNSEVASVLAEDTHIGGYAGMNAQYAKISVSAGADFANNTSSEESNSQAITHAKEVTERVLDRVVQKVKEERISKVVEEFEENNKHGFDNRKNDKHVSGVYRWVDKIYKNKIINYGKRLMYEFMIPEPAAFHTTAINENNILENTIEKPIDPRIATPSTLLKLDNTFENRYKNWLEIYNVEIEEKPEDEIFVGKAFSFTTGESLNSEFDEVASGNEEVKIPDGYYTLKAKASWYHTNETGYGLAVIVGGKLMVKNIENTVEKFKESIPVSYSQMGHHSGSVNVEIKCMLTPEAKQQWQINTFNAIIKAYEAKLEEYNAKVNESKALQTEKLRTNPLFYRQIENMVLRKNCIEYLVSHENLGGVNLISGNKLNDLQVKYTDVTLDDYAKKVKFLEQAFEWDLMSYNFYPFYWAYKEKWLDLYNVDESDDAIFRAFLQSGMARVILTIRPGFEEAVNWYMATGQVWNGGQVPTMDDELFLSIVDELRETEGELEETWETRVPTSLTIIQAGSIGMKVSTALPCDEDCKDYKLFDSDGNPELDEDGNPVSTNPFKIIKGLKLEGEIPQK